MLCHQKPTAKAGAVLPSPLKQQRALDWQRDVQVSGRLGISGIESPRHRSVEADTARNGAVAGTDTSLPSPRAARPGRTSRETVMTKMGPHLPSSCNKLHCGRKLIKMAGWIGA